MSCFARKRAISARTSGGDVPVSVEFENWSSDGSLVGVRIASTKTNGPHHRGQGAANDEENRERAAKASGEWRGPGAGTPRGADAGRDDDHAPALARVGPCARAGGAGRAVSRGGRGPGGPQRPASPAAHPSSLGHGGDGALLRRAAGAGAAPPRAADGRRGSDVALGGGVSRPGPADRADDAATARRGVDAPLRGQSRSAAERAAD